MALANTWLDGTYYRRGQPSEVTDGGRTRPQWYLEELTYPFHRRTMSTGMADRLRMACVTSPPPPSAREGDHPVAAEATVIEYSGSNEVPWSVTPGDWRLYCLCVRLPIQ